jgi:hypothetical protein
MDRKILAVAGIGIIGIGAYFLFTNNADAMPTGAGGGGGGSPSKKETTVTRTEPVINPSQPIFNVESPMTPGFPSVSDVTSGYNTNTTKKQDKSLHGVISRTHSNVPSGIPTTTYPGATNVSYPVIEHPVSPGPKEISEFLSDSTKKQRNSLPQTTDDYIDIVNRKNKFIPETPDITGVGF